MLRLVPGTSLVTVTVSSVRWPPPRSDGYTIGGVELPAHLQEVSNPIISNPISANPKTELTELGKALLKRGFRR